MSSNSSTRNWSCFRSGSPKGSASAWSTIAWNFTASPLTASAEPPPSRLIRWLRIAGPGRPVPDRRADPHPVEMARSAARPGRAGSSPPPRGSAGVRSGSRARRLSRTRFVIANHTSWLDILILGGFVGTAFVSKAELEKTPLLGWLADQNRTLYIDRAQRGGAHKQVQQIADALDHPQPLAVFPEGTTGSGRHLLPFRTTLLEAVAPPPPDAHVRPVAVDYGDHADVVGWHSGEPGMANVKRVLGHRGTMDVTVRLLHPLPPSDDRKALARHARQAIAAALSSLAGADRPIGATQMTDLPKTYRVKSFGCQMNVYDGERMAELLGAQGMTPGRRGRGRRPGRAQHLPYPRKSGREGLFGCRPPAPRGRQQADDRAGRLRRPGRGRRGQDAFQDDRPGGRAAGLSPPARDGRRGRQGRPPGRHRHAGDLEVRRASRPPQRSDRAPSSPSRKAATNSAPIASCPTLAARRSAGHGPTSSPRRNRWSTAARARSPCSARTSMPGAARTTRAAPSGSTR